MKKAIIMLSVGLLISLFSYSQKITSDKVPAPVKQSFTKMFPAAISVKFEMEKKDYEINFTDNGVEKSANFDGAGKWLETETGIKPANLPKEVTASIVKNFSGYKISEVAKVEKPGTGMIYEMDLKKDKEGYEVQFSPKGVFLNTVSLKGEK
jgi:Putative beta-lactamase-inhibitor-like, PepSY-like